MESARLGVGKEFQLWMGAGMAGKALSSRTGAPLVEQAPCHGALCGMQENARPYRCFQGRDMAVNVFGRSLCGRPVALEFL